MTFSAARLHSSVGVKATIFLKKDTVQAHITDLNPSAGAVNHASKLALWRVSLESQEV